MGSTQFFAGPEEVRRLQKASSEEFERARSYISAIVNPNRPLPPSDELTTPKKAQFLFAIEKSLGSLPGYATLDTKHIEDIERLLSSIKSYAKEKDVRRPRNCMLIAGPGSGKSHFINCLAEKLKKYVAPVIFNMATMRGSDDLSAALDQARNVTVDGRIPLLFLDEFDADEKYYSLLLPLLWDGEVVLGPQRLRLRHAVIVLAGSKQGLAEKHRSAGSMSELNFNVEEKERKIVDLFSRINGGVIEIPSLEAIEGRDRRLDKVCIAAALMRRKFGPRLFKVAAGLLRFIFLTRFKYEVRSLEHFIGQLREAHLRGSGWARDGEELAQDGSSDSLEPSRSLEPGKEELQLSFSQLKDFSRALENVNESRNRSFGYHLHDLHGETGLHEHWKACSKDQEEVWVWSNTFARNGSPLQWKEQEWGVYSYQLTQEVGGRKKDGDEVIDVTSFAGVEPLEITQLWLNPKIGEWLHGNKDAKMRHVFFKLSTIQNLLVETISKTKRDPRDLGRDMGSGFAKDFVAFVKELDEADGVSSGFNDIVAHWCVFDVSGGWGKWSHVPRGNGKLEGQLEVKNNFLASIPCNHAPEEDSSGGRHSPFCVIMEGYIEGVLSTIAGELGEGSSFIVEEIECGFENPRENPCRFSYNKRAEPVPRQ